MYSSNERNDKSQVDYSSEPASVSSSRKQRLLYFAKATRDNYIPRITGSVTSLATGVSNRTLGTSDYYDEDGNVRLPKGTSVTLYPTYTRQVDGKYYVSVKGWLSCPGVMSRKNRLILSLARQISRSNATTGSTVQAIDKLENENLRQDVFSSRDSSSSEIESVNSETSSLQSSIKTDVETNPNSSTLESGLIQNSASTNSDDMLRERLSSFMARSIPSAKLEIMIGSVKSLDLHDLSTTITSTDNNGHFEVCVTVYYEPSIVQVKSATEEQVFAFQDLMLMPNDGIGWISDIDDTIKYTGVVGDKRELMRNLLINEVSKWRIPSIVEWYRRIQNSSPVSFHYVSNSPWQLFPSIDKYFKEAALPKGSIHLKQYTGNIISSLLEPSSSRKRVALNEILTDFPTKKFICIGDSGEQDLEAYVDLAKSYPSRVLGIYIRYVEDSLSDVDDSKILKELQRIIEMNKRRTKVSYVVNPPNLIDMDGSPESSAVGKKLPPVVPKKPDSLKRKQFDRKPPLPERNRQGNYNDQSKLAQSQTDPQLNPSVSSAGLVDDLNQDRAPPALPKRPTALPSQSFANSKRAVENEDVLESVQNIYNIHHYDELEDYDKKGYNWIRRVMTTVESLRGTDTDLKIFTDDDEKFFDYVEDLVKSNSNNLL
ncbi:Piso0_001433 [Millerozyma farinosa CBS 7064]|uniref:Piso0_001433 protein n=1 Tax=Pichia sorbitophila (strain ATCC MYA-4447 / BCRC 22081 / CBS 7064 / NBRC 10061 / NRRL Y-12695) TaxID=559304 RepID=G8YN56_PICSO|nr:Piso0_001433 [Millerozyma farinosa CBS 7064]